MNIIATPYASVRAKLTEQINSAPWPSPEAGFLDYLHMTIGAIIPEHPLVTERLDETPMLASAGFQYINPHFDRPQAYDQQWAEHFRRLASRQAFPIDRESYFVRPLDLLGICIGARYCPHINDQDRAWLRTVLQQGRARIAEGSRSYYLGSIAAAHQQICSPIRTPTRNRECCEPSGWAILMLHRMSLRSK